MSEMKNQQQEILQGEKLVELKTQQLKVCKNETQKKMNVKNQREKNINELCDNFK